MKKTGRGGDTSFILQLKKQAKKLLVPYFLFEIVNLIVSLIFRKVFDWEIDIVSAIKSIVLCINTDTYPGISLRLWFLPCMFISNNAVWLLNKCTKNKNAKLVISIILFSFSLFLSTVYGGRLPFTLDISIMAVAFMILGYVCGKHVKDLIDNDISLNKLLISFAVTLICFSTCIYFNPGYFYMYINEYGNYFYAIIGALTGSWVFFVIANSIYKKLNKSSNFILCFLDRVVDWFGTNSLIIFPVHLEILFFVKKVNGVFLGGHWIIAYIITLPLTIVICEFVKRFMPFMLGKKQS